MRRVVVDTSVLVGAVLTPGGTPAQVLRACGAGDPKMVLSAGTLSEFAEVLARPAVRQRFRVSDEDTRAVLREIVRAATVFPGTTVRGAVRRHPNDDHVISAAVEAQADCIITGDEHLLALGEYEGIPILTPQEFLDKLNG